MDVVTGGFVAYAKGHLQETRWGNRHDGPVARYAALHMPPDRKSSMVPGGLGVMGADVNQWVLKFFCFTQTERALMDMNASLAETHEKVQELWKQYDDKMKAFRGVVKNDIVSLEASARKTTEAVHKMNTAYGNVITQLTSDDMVTAIQNAERLVVAMQALATLQAHKLVFSVAEQER